MNTANLICHDPDELVPPLVVTEYRSVVGAIAYAAMTQLHMLIYMSPHKGDRTIPFTFIAVV